MICGISVTEIYIIYQKLEIYHVHDTDGVLAKAYYLAFGSNEESFTGKELSKFVVGTGYSHLSKKVFLKFAKDAFGDL